MNDAIELRDALVGEGYLTRVDYGDLSLYNYTSRCFRHYAWNEITLHSRGSIFDRRTGECVARPFPKFFHVDEVPATMESALPWGAPFRIFEKLDGWLGIHYRSDGVHRIATRGSFDGKVAAWASVELQRYGLADLPDEVTLCFEILHPLTRVVVDYGDRAELVLLAAFNRHTGDEYDWRQVAAWAGQYGFRLPVIHGVPMDSVVRVLSKVDGSRYEGVVIRFDDGVRVKMKAPDYVARFTILRAEERLARRATYSI
jgi:RNA ligase